MDSSDDHDHVWSIAGPPAHWALSPNAPTFLKGIKSHSESRPGLVGVDVNVNVDVAVSGKEDDADDDGASIPIHNTNTN